MNCTPSLTSQSAGFGLFNGHARTQANLVLIIVVSRLTGVQRCVRYAEVVRRLARALPASPVWYKPIGGRSPHSDEPWNPYSAPPSTATCWPRCRVAGKDLVLWRDGGGEWRCFADKCAHRNAPLSEGRIEPQNGSIMCSYHGADRIRVSLCCHDSFAVACAVPSNAPG